MKTLRNLLIAAVIISSISIAGCSKNEDILDTSLSAAITNSDSDLSLLDISQFPEEDLNEYEVEALSQMREEELLARDIYLQLFEIYNYRIFENIAKSEEKHTSAVKLLLDRYQLNDVAISHEIGLFINADIQALHDALLAQGIQSLTDALVVGATIEDVDIFDLHHLLENGVDNADITYVFQNLVKGSENHMRAFVKNLLKLNYSYTPQYITQEEFDSIIN